MRYTPAIRSLASRLPLGLPIRLSDELEHALQKNLPVVAFESTIATHGLPPEQALLVPLQLEAIARSRGCVPCTFGMLNGVIYAGLSESQLTELVESRKAVKLSKRDLAPAIVKKLHGSTTVAATSYLAHLCGINVFATGGIGGVHRGAESSMDVSADLTELARTPTAVVCAGAKSILDIGRTLEYLETHSVTVATFGPNKDFPAFYSAKSGFQSPYNVETGEEAASLMKANESLKNKSGILFAVPIPSSEEPRAASIQEAVDQAVRESEEKGIARSGKDVTPWLLSRVKELSKGSSVLSNIALIKNNTEIACQIAKAYHGPGKGSSSQPTFQPALPHQSEEILVVGAAAIDITAQVNNLNIEVPERQLSEVPNYGTTVAGTVRSSPGGVARNMAEAAHRLGASTKLATSFNASDPFGATLTHHFADLRMPVHNFEAGPRTAVCNSILQHDGQLLTGVADMDSTFDGLSLDELDELVLSSPAPIVAFDANLSQAALSTVRRAARETHKLTFFEPTSNTKALRILDDESTLPLSNHIAPSLSEFRSLTNAIKIKLPAGSSSVDVATFKTGQRLIDWVSKGEDLRILSLFDTVWLKLGADGVLVMTSVDNSSEWPSSPDSVLLPAQQGKKAYHLLRHYPAEQLDSSGVTSVTGAGDSLAGALLALLARNPRMHQTRSGMDEMVSKAQKAAVFTLQSQEAVSRQLSPALLH